MLSLAAGDLRTIIPGRSLAGPWPMAGGRSPKLWRKRVPHITMTQNKRIILWLLLVTLVLLVVACKGEPADTSGPTIVPVSAAPTAVATASATATPVPTLAPAPTAALLPTPTLEPTATVIPRVSVIGIARPTPTATPPPPATPTLEEMREIQPPHVFIGTVLIDGLPAQDGTVVAAMVGGVEVAAVEVEDGKYTNLQVGLAGKFVTFKIGNAVANETFVSEVGGVDLLNLTVTSDY